MVQITSVEEMSRHYFLFRLNALHCVTSSGSKMEFQSKTIPTTSPSDPVRFSKIFKISSDDAESSMAEIPSCFQKISSSLVMYVT